MTGISPPPAEPCPVHRATDLGATGGADLAVKFKEALTFGVVVEAEEFQQARQRPWQILHPIVQVQAQDRVRQDGRPVRHQAVVLGDVPAEVAQVVRVGVVAHEAPAEDGEADVSWITYTVYDACLWHQQRHQTQHAKVARHFVDDPGRPRRERVQVLQVPIGLRC